MNKLLIKQKKNYTIFCRSNFTKGYPYQKRTKLKTQKPTNSQKQKTNIDELRNR